MQGEAPSLSFPRYPISCTQINKRKGGRGTRRHTEEEKGKVVAAS